MRKKSSEGEETKNIANLFGRYIFLLLLGWNNLYFFYKVLTPLKIKTVSFIISLFQEVNVLDTLIIVRNFSIDIVPACVAGAAFYLMFVLVFSTPHIEPKKRVKVLLLSVISLYVLNVARILFLFYMVGSPFFEVLHWVIWNLVSTLLVVIIWVTLVRFYHIKSIPLYSDVLYLLGLVKNAKKAKRK